jgi:hypothetical protein
VSKRIRIAFINILWHPATTSYLDIVECYPTLRKLIYTKTIASRNNNGLNLKIKDNYILEAKRKYENIS